MISTLSAASSAIASQAQINAAAANAVDSQLNSNQLNDLIHQQLGMDSHSPLPADVETFYTMGPDAVAPTQPPVNTASTMSLDSANLFNDLPRYLNQVGGPSDPTAMLTAQVQVIQASLGWQLMGEIAAKSVTGIQSLLNNQV